MNTMQKGPSQKPPTASPRVPPNPAQPASPLPQPKPAPLSKRYSPSKPFYKEVKPKVGENVLVCSLYALIILIVLAAAILIGVAKTGLFTIPIASGLYHGPEPTRIVEAGVMDTDAFVDQISRSVSSAVLRGEKAPYTVPITEADLTAMARGGLADIIREERVIPEGTQIVVTPEYVEASGTFLMDAAKIDLLIQFIPVIEENELRFDISKAYLGDIPVSSDLAKSMESLLFTKDFAAWSVNMGSVSLRSVNLKDGELEFILDEAK